ncbi:MAG TPA: ABC-F family ATP-binding cassette domain-containing protein [Phycisphaerales bacterium]|nr:ABC-F family ATP-binding cassette domain-containing protein [Phycisphaerales bacterium]HMP36357.1 ABC-F family ATP-binding cassette domain-containing protein [Phycisphaerales bacterium]
MLLAARNISRSHGARTLFRGVSISVDEGDRIGLIGPNGAGKSTLLRILARDETQDEGELVAARGLRAVYVPQQDRFDPSSSARDIVRAAARAGWQAGGPAPTPRAGGPGSGSPGERGDAAHAIDPETELAVEQLADQALARLGFEEPTATTAAAALSGGWRKRLALACAAASHRGAADLLLLDEPTNHIDLAGIRRLEALLLGQRGGGLAAPASIFVTHDRAFLDAVATRVVELSDAYPDGTLDIRGNYAEFLRRREEFLDGQRRSERTLANEVRRDVVWGSRGAQARRTKAKGRIEENAGRAEELAALRLRNRAAAGSGAALDFAASGRRTRRLVSAEGVAKGFGGRALFSGVDLELGPGDRLGLLGSNGSGKSTLIGVLVGALAPDAGSVRMSDPPPSVAFARQMRDEIPEEIPLRDALAPSGLDTLRFAGRSMHVATWARRFLFRDDQLDQRVGLLSGGERARLHLARIMLEPADILVLDEPTNDLDIPTLEVLEEAIDEFPGAVILVTHDRAMLERIAHRIVFLDGAGTATIFASLDQALAAELESERRAAAASREARRRSETPQTSVRPAAPSRRKLSFAEEREYQGMESKILEAESSLAEAEAKVGTPAIASDHARLAEACRALEAAQRAVDALYARWSELEAIRVEASKRG